MESENELRERLLRLHGAPIDKEMGGLVDKAKARQLIQILELGAGYPDIDGERYDETLDRYVQCVDVSDYLEEAEPFDQ